MRRDGCPCGGGHYREECDGEPDAEPPTPVAGRTLALPAGSGFGHRAFRTFPPTVNNRLPPWEEIDP